MALGDRESLHGRELVAARRVRYLQRAHLETPEHTQLAVAAVDNYSRVRGKKAELVWCTGFRQA